MKITAVLISLLVFCFFSFAAKDEAEESLGYLSMLSKQEVDQSQIIGLDSSGIPMVCGTGLEKERVSGSYIPNTVSALPINTRSWESIPSVIRDDGIETFRLEVTVTEPVNGISLDSMSISILPPATPPVTLLDDGTGEDRIAGDGIYTAGPFRFNIAATIPEYYSYDSSSPKGLHYDTIGTIQIIETNDSITTFLIPPELGILSSDKQPVQVLLSTPDLIITPNLINIQSDSRESQLHLRLLGGDLRKLTKRIYEVLPDAFDFFIFTSTDKIEHTSRTMTPNFVAGVHSGVQVDYSGTGQGLYDATAAYGSPYGYI